MRYPDIILTVGTLAMGVAAQVSSNGSAIFPLSNDTEFAFMLEATLSHSNNFGANTGEVLRAASQIIPGDFDSWYREFIFLANQIHGKAEAINAKRFPVSAREAYFRSATYYRAATTFLYANISDPRIYSVWDSALGDFDKAISLLPVPAERVNIPANNFTIPAIFYSAQSSVNTPNNHQQSPFNSTKRPTVIVGSGYDGSQEELYHSIGRAILDRGWNFITYEGPGQPTVRRQQGLGFIHNWWEVVTPVVDYLTKRHDVDMDKIGLIGVSFGGTLAPLAASREDRLSAVVAIDGLTDLFSALQSQFPPQINSLFESGNKTEFDALLLSFIGNPAMPTELRWIIAQSLWVFKTTSPFEWLTKLRDFKVDQTVANGIHCPVLIGEGENDSSAPGQAQEMMQFLRRKATYNLFKTDLGAGEHCQLGAEAQVAQVTLDWLSDVWEGINVPHNMTGGVY
ncbi:uncharacterized protein TrAtP1_006589 [Trichoderma atroviride]|uniref:BAAT/Acyl-CoA thioester hydrolase C-terminal domain-containing protein n=1 Tax=Hypocrea atroviridis (strain ATCC 20476 / IMI 206040) TaxID=452589 RepID=G9PA14_HYPAI|nr:uncharacterized protein TRIATDRAFT_268944 [Trichoderma atroviride IMI 206040]EHK40485.1 hypothetical protein TRIATDRAFT_268944 [Trichoderma atroviride IMI 206040]UKZ65396.1 hypothetical protein TrAtP1_006589 [Trichoderma atroviride]